MADLADRAASNPIVAAARSTFISMGILPVLLIGSLILFGTLEERFLDGRNLFNVVRQTTYLAIVSMGQMVCLLTAGFDLSIGSTMALTSVVSALVIISYLASSPEAYTTAIILGLIAGIGVGVIVGSINGIGVAVFNVPPFMMTLGMLSVVLGVALTISGGTPIYGIPKVFKEVFGYGRLFEIPAPVYYTVGIVRGPLFHHQLDQDGPLLLCHWQQSTGRAPVGHKNAQTSFLRLHHFARCSRRVSGCC